MKFIKQAQNNHNEFICPKSTLGTDVSPGWNFKRLGTNVPYSGRSQYVMFLACISIGIGKSIVFLLWSVCMIL